jgi:glutathione S-transferase
MSQPSRALWIFFKLNRLPVEFVKVDLMKMEHLTDEFKAINRFQKVPCIVDEDNFKLSESVAIFRYLMQSRNDSFDQHWYPKCDKTRAQIDEYLEWQHNNTRFKVF